MKHFKKWVDSPLLFYALFSESPTACVLAHFLLGINYNGPKSFQSQERGATVNLAAFSAFIKENCSTVNLKKVLDLPHVKNCRAELLMIKQNIDMWDTKQDNLPLGRFRNKFLRKSGGLGSNAQCTERGVKEAGYVSLGRRGESSRSILALARGETVEEVGIALRKRKREEKEKKTGESCSEESIQVQNKSRAMQVIIETDKQQIKLNKIRVRDGKEKYKEARSQVRNSLKCKDAQFKTAWIETKFRYSGITFTNHIYPIK